MTGSVVAPFESAATYRGTSAAVILLLKTAREHGILVNRTKLAKLLYLADLEAVERDLPPATDVEWRWRHYGPYSDVLQAVENDLYAAAVIGVAKVRTDLGSKEVRLRLVETAPQIQIDARFAEIIEHIVRTYGHLSAVQLKDYTYQTTPMRAALRRGEREVRLDLAGGEPYPDIGPVIQRMKNVLAEMPPPADEPGGVEDLVDEIDEWATLRRAATSQMVDDE